MPQHDLTHWFIEDLARYLPEAFTRLGAQPFSSEVGAPVEQVNGPRLWWEQPLSYPPGAKVLIGAADHVRRALGSELLTGATRIEADGENSSEAYLAAITQACEAAAQAFGGRLKRDCICLQGRTLHQPSIDGVVYPVVLTQAAGPVELLISFTIPIAPTSSGRDGEMNLAPQRVTPPPDEPSRPIDLLLDVELPVSVSFGRAQLPLKDVIKLTSGSIVELNRTISEPVEVIVNNCVIARGEVVVIEGNYGVRIDQIVSRQERLRSLK